MWPYLDLSPGYVANGFQGPKVVGVVSGLALCSGYEVQEAHKQQARLPRVSNNRTIYFGRHPLTGQRMDRPVRFGKF